MRILHLCLASFYIDGYNYQENVLPRINKEDGHEVKIIASTESFIDNMKPGYIEPGEYMTEYGVPIKRLPYVKVGSPSIMTKFRKYPNVYEEIAAFKPDVIMSHSLSYWSILDTVRYVKEHPEVKFYADTHTTAFNSGRNWASRNILHRIFYRWLIGRAVPYLDKYFYLSVEELEFSLHYYKVPAEITEFYPLGGSILPEAEYCESREKRRKELGVAEDEKLVLHTGKLDALKRTDELLQAFAAVPQMRAKLAIIGSIPEEQKEILDPLIAKDSRVMYLGWKSAEELQEYLCACDLYAQPGSGSATMQNAVCRKCALLLYPHKSYVTNFDYDNILWARTTEDMKRVFQSLADGTVDLEALRRGSEKCAEEILDYRKLAARLYR